MSVKDRSDKLVGTVYNSGKFGDYEIIYYGSVEDVLIRFHNTGYVTKSGMQRIRAGGVVDKLAPTSYGVGYFGENPLAVCQVDGKKSKEYVLWQSMMQRCYSSVRHDASPNYIGCSVSDYFKSFGNFYDWCQSQDGFKLDGWALDKDLLFKGNTMYSEDNCVFLPSHINTFLVKPPKPNKTGYIGVSYVEKDKRYKAVISKYGKQMPSKYFKTAEEASNEYVKLKKQHAVELADQHKDNLDVRAYHGLCNYEPDVYSRYSEFSQ